MNISLKNRNLGVKETLAKNQRKILTMERKNISNRRKRNVAMTAAQRHIDNHLFPDRLRFRTLTSCVALLH